MSADRSYQRHTCRMCESSRLEVVMQCEPTPCGDHYVPESRLGEPQPRYPLDLAFCADCALLQLPYVVDPELLYRDYIYNTSISLGLADHFDAYADSLAEWSGAAAGSLVVDIGSNDGTLLGAFKRRGFAVLGVDPARDQARRATEAGIPTENAFFTAALADDLRANHGPAAIVTANNVFANVDDLKDLIEGIRRLLAPDGVFAFETGYGVDLVRGGILDNVYHEHLSYYAVLPLQRFFAANGMELVRIEHVPTKGGSLRGMVQLGGRQANGDRGALGRLIAAEQADGFTRANVYRAFAAEMAAVRDHLTRTLGDSRARGKTFAGYGASVGVTTLLYYFGLGDTLDFLVDDNPARHGLFTPGHHLPVLPSCALYDKRPDEVVVLAWRYADPIAARHEGYHAAGGRFIVPLPVVHAR